MNKLDFKKMFDSAPHKYPTELERHYPRILESILMKWENPKEEEEYLSQLVVDFRGTRQGFPKNVMDDLLRISKIYSKWLKAKSKRAPLEVIEKISEKEAFKAEHALPKMDAHWGHVFSLLKSLIDTGGELQLLESLKETGWNINQKGEDGRTLLMEAVLSHKEDLVIFFIKNGANPHMKDVNGNTALHWAVVSNQARMVDVLLYFGANPNTENKMGATALSLACIKEDAAMTQRLFDYGGNVNELDREGNTPLHKAIVAKAKNNIQLLINLGASVNLQNKKGVSAEMLLNQSLEFKEIYEHYKTQKFMEALDLEGKRR